MKRVVNNCEGQLEAPSMQGDRGRMGRRGMRETV